MVKEKYSASDFQIYLKDAMEKAKMFYAYFDGYLLHANLYQEPLNPDVMTKAFLALLLGPA